MDSTITIMDPCEAEIIRLHDFFVEWFTARSSCGDFDKVSRALASDFHMISPRGVMETQPNLLDSLRSSYGCHRGSGFRIEIRNCKCLHKGGGGVSLWKYEEWQFTGGSGSSSSGDSSSEDKETETARISTVLFRDSKEGYNGVQWVHVHETWMPGKE